MRFGSPAWRLMAVVGVAVALIGGGAAIAATADTGATRIDTPALAADPAVRITTTVATTTTVVAVTAPSLATRGPGTLLFPMNPLPTCLMLDNYGDGRDGGRVHQGTDIMSSLGREIYAVKDGVLVDQVINGESGSSLSGNTWVLRATDKDVYKYMHLSGFVAGLQVGSTVVKGQLIGFVGDTGNPGPGNYHLHFEVHPGGGAAVDPYPLLDIPTACSG